MPGVGHRLNRIMVNMPVAMLGPDDPFLGMKMSLRNATLVREESVLAKSSFVMELERLRHLAHVEQYLAIGKQATRNSP